MPLVEDNRLDAQFPIRLPRIRAAFNQQYPNLTDTTTGYRLQRSTYSSNIGDDDSGGIGVARLGACGILVDQVHPGTRRGIYHNPANPEPADQFEGFRPGTSRWHRRSIRRIRHRIRRRFRGIQIQIRVVDFSNQRIKTLTILQGLHGQTLNFLGLGGELTWLLGGERVAEEHGNDDSPNYGCSPVLWSSQAPWRWSLGPFVGARPIDRHLRSAGRLPWCGLVVLRAACGFYPGVVPPPRRLRRQRSRSHPSRSLAQYEQAAAGKQILDIVCGGV